MCDCFHLAFPNWHAASSGTGAGRRLRAPEPGTEDDSICDEPSQFTEGERPRPQGSSPVEEFPEKYTDSDLECEAEHDPQHKGGSGKKSKKSGLGSMFEKRSTPKMSKLKEVHSPESGVIVKTAKDGCAEGLIYGGGGKEGIFIKQVVPESPASKSLKLKEGDQVLSATVYFDNVSYEDAIQILEHAQAYKVKLCLKRKPDTETEAAIDSDVIPEEDIYPAEMREQGKTKRRGDARISWPKFPSFGKGRKSRFTRSHSSSEADEQRKLELSPTTSDTESPIKTQDALKGKKRHKMKLSVLTKRGRISSSEDQDTDVPSTGQTSGDNYQTASDMVSPECLESLSGEAPEIHLTEDMKGVEDLRPKQNDQKITEPATGQHKVELISIDNTLKTADITVALANQEIPPEIKSPGDKKKKKERSELKMKLLGKDKSHKKDAKAKASPKRLKTLGASLEVPDQPENEKSDVAPCAASRTEVQRDQVTLDGDTQIISSEMTLTLPKVELDTSDVTLVQKSPKKGEEKTKKSKDTKQKQEKKTGSIFKLPKIGLTDITIEETIQQQINEKVEEGPTKSTAGKEDPYDKLSKVNLSTTQLPKREEIEIPGMEDKSVKTTVKRIKEPKVTVIGHDDDSLSEAVQMAIDVDSVKEAVSKLPGFKVPKVDTSGMPIPEEVTLIDANAQRITVKTPTKVVDTKAKQEAHFSEFDINVSSELSKTTIKLPKITADLTSHELLTETMVDLKRPEIEQETKPKHSDKEMKTEAYKREDILIAGKESAQEGAIPQSQKKKTKITVSSFGISKPDIKIPIIGIDFPKQNTSEQKGSAVKGERTILLQGVTSKTETKKSEGKIEGVITDIKIPGIDNIEYIDSVGVLPTKKDGGISLTGFGVDIDATKPKADISSPEVRREVKDAEAETHTIKLTKTGLTPDISVNVPDADMDVSIDGAHVKILESEEKGSKFKIPTLGISMPKVKGPKIDVSLSKKDVTLPEAKAEVKLPETPATDITLGNVDVSVSEPMVAIDKPELEIKPLQNEGELDGQGSKFKIPKLGIKMPKIKGPELDLRLSKRSGDVTLPESKADVKLPQVPEIDASLGSGDVSLPMQKVKTPELEMKPLQTDAELDGQGSKFKMPKLGITMPKVKGPEIDFSLLKKDIDVTLPEAKVGVKVPDAPEVDITVGHIDISIPEKKIEVEKPELEVKPLQTEIELDGQGSKFKMPKFGIKMPKFKGPEFDVSLSKKDVHVTLPETKAEGTLPDAPEIDASVGSIDVSIPAQKVDVEKPELEIKPLHAKAEIDGQGSKFKMPKLGIKMPKIKGPEFDVSLAKKDVDATLPEVKAEGKLPDAPEIDASVGSIGVSIPVQKMDVKKPEVEIKPLQTEVEFDGQGSKFKMPKLGITIPKLKGPEFDLSLSRKDVDVSIPEAKAEVKLPDAPVADVTLGSIGVSIPEQKMDIKTPELKPLQAEAEIAGQGSKFKMPKFGIKMPKIKGPEFDLSLSKKDVDVTIPEVKAEGKLPTAPEIDASLGGVDVSISKPVVEVDKPELEMKPLQSEVEIDGQGSKFKMPKFGIKMPKMKGPEFDLSLSKKDVDVTLPEVKAERKLPTAPEIDASLGGVDVSISKPVVEVDKPELEIKPLHTEAEFDGQGSKFKMPKFGIKMPKIKGPEFDLSLSKKDVDVKLPEVKVDGKLPTAPEVDASVGSIDVSISKPVVEVDKPEFEVKGLETEVETDGHGGKFKMPKFGITMPKVKGPEIDFSIQKKEVDFSLQQAEAEMKLPDVELKDPSAKVEVKVPEIKGVEKDIEGSPSKFKMPSFKLPKFGASTRSVNAEVSGKAKDVQIPETQLKSPEGVAVDITAPSIDIEGPSLDVKTTAAELDGKSSKFKMPKFGISLPKVKGPEMDLSLSKKDVDVTLPEADVKLPDEPVVKVEVKAPEIAVHPQEIDGSPSKFKMPTFKLPKFGMGAQKASVEVPDVDKDVKMDEADINIPDEGLGITIAAPSIDIEGPSVGLKTTVTEQDGKGSKFKMPHFGFSMPKVKGPKIDSSLSKKDVDITLPEAKVDVRLPEVNLGKGDVSIPESKIDGPELKGEVKLPKTSVEIKSPEYEAEMDGHGGKFKMPKFGIKMPKVKGPEFDLSLPKKEVDLELPETKADVKLPEIDLGKVEVSIPEAKPEVEIQTLETEGKLDGQGGKFKMPKFGIKMPKLKGPEFDLSLSKKDVDARLPEVKTELPDAEVEIKAPEIDVPEGSPSKFTMPNFGVSMPKVKGPDIDLNLSKKHTDVTIPDTKAEVKLPEAPKIDVSLGKAEVLMPKAEVEVQKPEMQIRQLQTDVDLEGQGGKFKMPKFGISMPKVKGPQIDLSFSKKDADVTLPVEKAEAEIPEPPKTVVDVKALEYEAEIDGQGSKFKMPKFGIAMPKVKGPEIDLSLSKKDVDVTLPEVEAKLPDVELKDPSAQVEFKASGTVEGHVEGSPSKFKLPTFRLPKFGAATPTVSAEVPDLDKDIKVDGAKHSSNIDIKTPSVDVKMTGTEGEGKGGKFKMPKFGISLPKVQGPEIDLSLPKKDVAVKLPEAKAEVKYPEGPEVDVNLGKIDVSIPEAAIEVKKPELELRSEGELEGQGSKLKMPKIGMSMPKVKGPEIDFSLSKKDVEVTLPEGKAEINLPDVKVKDSSAKVEVKAPEIEAQLSSVKESPSKFKLPSFKFPRFGVATPNITAEVPDTDKEIKIDGADKHISAPDTDVDIPEVKAEVCLPEVEVKEPSGVVIEQPAGVEVDVKLKKPRFSLPKFSFSKPNVKAPEVAVDPQDITVAVPKGKVEVKGGEVAVNPPEVEADIDGQGTKFKMPKLGITMPKVTGPEIDFSSSKKDVDVTLPETKAKIKIPDVKVKELSTEVEVKAPEIKVGEKDTEGSPSKFKMPTLKLPKFGVGTVPEIDKDIKIDGEEEVLAVTIDSEGPSIDMKPTGIEGKGSKFKLPSLGFSAPHVKGPEVDLSLSKKDVDVTLPEVKADVQLPDVELKEPSAKVEIKAPGVDIQATNIEGSPSKFKMPTFKLPKFGATTQISVEGPEVDRDIKVDGADLKLPEAKVEVKLPDVQIKAPEAPLAEVDANVKKSWTLPKFSFSKTNIKSPESDVSLDTPKVDVTLPEVKAEIHPPDIEIEDAKLKKPKFGLPKFSFSKQSTKELEVDANLPEGVSLPEVNVEVKPPEVQVKQPEVGLETDGHESRFKMPKFGITMPKVKGPEIDLSLSKKDVDVTPPKVKGEVQLPDVKTKQPSAKVEIKAPEIEAQTGNVEVSPSKLKMPTFTLPKFGAATPKVDVQVSDVNKDVKIDGAKVQVPKVGATVDVKGPSIETEDLSVEGSGSRFKMPKFGITMPKVKGPEIDLSSIRTDIDVTAPKVKGEVQLPDVKTKQPSAKVEIKATEIEAQTGNVEGSPSKLKMPTFTLPKFGSATTKVDVQVPDVDKVPKEGVTVDVAGPSIDTEGVSVEGSGSKFKMPKFGITMPKVKGPEIDITLPKTDVTLPEAKVEATLTSGDIKEPEGASSVPDTPTAEVDAKMKRSNWTFPKFSFSRTGGKAPDVDVNIETPNADVTPPEASLPNVEVKGPSGVISVEEPSAGELDANLKKPKFSLPKFSFSKTSATVPEVSAEPLQVDVSLPEGEVKVKQPAVEVKTPELEAEHDTQGSKFKFPKFGITLPKAKGPEVDLNASIKDGDATLPEVKAEVKLPEVQVKESSASVETEIKMKDGGGSPLKFKMPTLKMPKLGSASYDVTVEAPDAVKAETEEPKEVIAVNIKGPSIDIKTDTSKTSTLDSETPKTETDGVGLGSPSKFKMPSFKMPKLSFSRSKAEDEQVPAEDESRDDQLKNEAEPQEETKSPKLTLTSFGEILKNIDVEFDVPKTDKVEENLETLKEVQETGEPGGKQLETKEKDTNAKQDTTKSPERTGWFKFPRFGLSSPSEPAKTPEKDEQKDEKSPVGETGDEVSPTSSVQSSDAFADISSAMTSEHVGLSLSSPTKVTVKYTGPDVSSGFGEIHKDIITSTTSTGLISVEPNLPEKVTILSSGVSSSSEDTLRLESGKIHVITSNIQATPEAQHAKIVTAVQIQSSGGLTVESEADKAVSSTVQESQSSTRSIFGRYFTRETSTERTESKETIVITKQITRSSEPISGETASSIQRLKDSVHSEKMRFFDGAEK